VRSDEMPHLSKAAYLKAALDDVFELPLPFTNLPPGLSITDWVMQQDIHGWRIGPDMRCIGFRRGGYLAARYLVKRLRADHVTCRRVVTATKLTVRVLDEIRTIWMQGRQRPAKQVDIDNFERQLMEWLRSFEGERIHLIPCKILEGAAETFFIGSICFVHIDTFDPATYHIREWERASASLVRCMQRDDAKWIGIVKVNDCEPSRSEEIAEFIVDLSLGALQTILVDVHALNIARVTGRTMPSHKGSLLLQADGNWSARSEVKGPGLVLLPNDFNEIIRRSESELARMGRRIDAYRTGITTVPVLEQAWCDAVFWFHEGFSEPLDAVAIVKMETAIENLFVAGGTAKTKAQLIGAFERLLGLKNSSLIDTRLPVTVDQFISAVITARSRILHGTWSALGKDDLEVDRSDVAKLARTFLLLYTQFLDLYVESATTPADNVRAFFEWIDKKSYRREARSVSSQI
jgi:hypothetical protein